MLYDREKHTHICQKKEQEENTKKKQGKNKKKTRKKGEKNQGNREPPNINWLFILAMYLQSHIVSSFFCGYIVICDSHLYSE